MKLHQEKRDVTRSGELVETQFKIKATAKAFGILSSGLYSDKILAIIRELSCNAYDAHVAAGRREDPIHIKLPTSLDPTFYVKDFGIGLDHAGVTELYTTYFESTKSDSNDFVGALGLGSKSPFSYVPTFTVEARFKGIRRVYSAFINEDGVPAITKLDETATDEGNGLTVSLATKSGDAEKFSAAARKALMYFDVQPKVIGGGAHFKPYSIKYTVSGTNWKLREADYYAHMEGAYVVQGLVSYPIDKDILRQHGLSDVGHMILSQNIDLFVKIGDVEVAASREALSYTKKTIENLVRIVDTAAKEMRDSIQKEFDKQPSLWDARVLHATYDNYHHKMHNLYERFSRVKPFTFGKSKLEDEVKVDLKKIVSTQLAVTYVSRHSRGRNGVHKIRAAGSWDPSNATKEFGFTIRPSMQVVVDDVHGGKPMMALHFDALRAKNPNDSDDVYVLVIKGLSKNAYDLAEVNTILTALGISKPTYMSQLSYVVAKQKYTYRAKKSDEAMEWKGFPENGGYRRDQLRRVFSRLSWVGKKIDIKKGGYFVPVDRFTIMRGTHEQTMFDVFLSSMQFLGILKKSDAIIGLTEKQVANVKRNKAWINVFDYAEEQFAEMNAKGLLTNKVVGEKLMYSIGEGVRRHIIANWDAIEPKLVNGTFKNVFTKAITYNEARGATTLKYDGIEQAANQLTSGNAFTKKVKDDIDSFMAEFERVMSKHAMLKLVDWSKVGAKDVDMIVDYVNFVAKS